MLIGSDIVFGRDIRHSLRGRSVMHGDLRQNRIAHTLDRLEIRERAGADEHDNSDCISSVFEGQFHDIVFGLIDKLVRNWRDTTLLPAVLLLLGAPLHRLNHTSSFWRDAVVGKFCSSKVHIGLSQNEDDADDNWVCVSCSNCIRISLMAQPTLSARMYRQMKEWQASESVKSDSQK